MNQPRDHAGELGPEPQDEADVDLVTVGSTSGGPTLSSESVENLDPRLVEVLESAARLQDQVPDAVLVGGSAAALCARRRLSFDHDHVLGDLRERFDVVLEAIEREPDWTLNRATPGKIILGSLGDIEAGVRQLIRKRPLEVEEAELPSGARVRVPTEDEMLRIKAFLIVRRNQVRDYLDVAALSAHLGSRRAAEVLSHIDDYYADETKNGDAVATQLVRQLGDPRPKDTRSLDGLPRYKGLITRWQSWDAVREQCRLVSAHMLDEPASQDPGPDFSRGSDEGEA